MRNHFRTTLRHIVRSPYQAFAAISISSMTFFLAATFTMVALGSTVVLSYFETRPQVIAFFKDDASAGQIAKTRDKLNSSGLATEVKFVSKEEALNIYREQNKNDPQLLEMVTANILPASLEISAKDAPSLKQLADVIRKEPLVDEVLFQEDIISAVSKWTRAVRIVGIALVGSFSLLALLTILIVIGMKISSKKEEVETLNLIGADKWYIITPFLLEGIFYGVSGALIGWGISLVSLLYSTPFLVTFLAGLPLLPIPIWFYFALLAGLLLMGLILGFASSHLAVKRYLR